MISRFLATAIFSLCLVSASLAQGDSRSDFLLRFNGSLNSSTGEPPVRASDVTFEEGISDKGARFTRASVLDYSSDNKINLSQGSIELWVKPQWNSDDNLDHVFVSLGSNILFYKDEWNFLNCYLRYDDHHWLSVPYYFPQTWTAGKWHHIAVTWSLPGKILLYVDGYMARYRDTPIRSLYPQLPENLSIGDWDAYYPADAVIDELRISKTARSAKEIAASFASPLQVTSLAPQSNPVEMFRDWNMNTHLLAETKIGTVKMPLAAASAVSRNPEVARVQDGRLLGLAEGTATIGASINGVRTGFTARVRTAARAPEIDVIPKYLEEPAENCLYTIPVVMIKYLPTRDGVNVDSTVVNYTGTLDGLNSRITYGAIQTKFILEEGSRFHGYKDPLSNSSIGYRIVYSITIYEDTPPGFPTTSPNISFTDYNLILNRIGAQNFVENRGVKEFWLWTAPHSYITGTESNMSSPTTGDVSNSYRINDDMPIYDRTYTLYDYNFTRGSNENVHDHGHQLEALLGYVNLQQDGNRDLFWKKFVGMDENYNFTTGRCGWTHMPPNTTVNYDYGNMTLRPSDIETWTPEGLGSRQLVNAATWRDLPYAWVLGTRPVDVTQPHWYIYWMQNMPGRNNAIPYGNAVMTNWWAFTGDWDESIGSRLGLYSSFAAEPGGVVLDNAAGLLDREFSNGERIFNSSCESDTLPGSARRWARRASCAGGND